MNLTEGFILTLIMFCMIPVSFILGAYLQYKISTNGFPMVKRKTKMVSMSPEKEYEREQRRNA